jgi:hypothetical protein
MIIAHEEHRDVRADDHTPTGGDGTPRRPPRVSYTSRPPWLRDQEREQVDDHRPDEAASDSFGVNPAGMKKHRDDAPGDEGRDVRQDHAGQERAELLYRDAELPPAAIRLR